MTKINFYVDVGVKNKVLGNFCVKIYEIGGCERRINKFSTTNKKFCVNVHGNNNSLYYISVRLLDHGSIDLINVFKKRENDVVGVNERTTIANIYCFNNFIKYRKNRIIIKDKYNLSKIAYGMRKNFIQDNGNISSVIKNGPNGNQTNSYAMFNYLSNIYYYSIASSKIYNRFSQLTNASNPTKGVLNLSKNPFNNVEKIYYLINTKPPIYTPALNLIELPNFISRIPNQWTLTIKVNDTGSKNFIFGGPGGITFDKEGKAWITNNVRQGTPNSSNFCVVLKPNGKPYKSSPLFGGGLLGGGLGVSYNKNKDLVALGNYGWGPIQYNPQFGSVTYANSLGTISPSDGYTNGINRVQGLLFDKHNNLWMTSWGTQKPEGSFESETLYRFPNHKSRVVVYINADPMNYVYHEFDSQYTGPFNLKEAPNGDIYLSNSGSNKPPYPPSVYRFRLINNKIVIINSWIDLIGEAKDNEIFKDLAIDSKNNIFVCSFTSSSILQFTEDLIYVKRFTNYIYFPWGLHIDVNDNIYVANFTTNNPSPSDKIEDGEGPFGFTIIYNQKDSNSKFFNLNSGGDPVLLANGSSLYGTAMLPSYEPLMRLTALSIDSIGNVWTLNNWKPSLPNNVRNNPGGDGIVIFIGVAKNHLVPPS